MRDEVTVSGQDSVQRPHSIVPRKTPPKNCIATHYCPFQQHFQPDLLPTVLLVEHRVQWILARRGKLEKGFNRDRETARTARASEMPQLLREGLRHANTQVPKHTRHTTPKHPWRGEQSPRNKRAAPVPQEPCPTCIPEGKLDTTWLRPKQHLKPYD